MSARQLIIAIGAALISFVCSIPGLNAQTNDSGCVLHYDFSEGSGSTLHDTGGNGYHGTIGPFMGGWVKAGNGYALEFEGESSWPQLNATGVSCPDDPGLEMKLSDWTITVLVKLPQSVTNAGMILVQKGGHGDGACPGYALRVSGREKKIFANMTTTRHVEGSQKYEYNRAEAPYQADGQWRHVAAVYNRQKDLQMYVDGKPCGKPVDISARKDAIVESYSENLRLYLGWSTASACSMADVAIYRRALSSQEVKQMSAELLKKVAGEKSMP